MDVVIRHDGNNWVIENEDLHLASPTLDQLDLELGNLMRAKGMVAKGQTTQVFMGFDNATIPQWIRPFAQHYFNRLIEVKG